MPGRLSILVIDDDVVDRMNVQRALRTSGLDHAAEETDSARTALGLMAKRRYDVVLLDYLLPDGNGLDVVQEARRSGVRTPIIILTGQGDERIAVELMKAGASDYLPKAHASPERLAQSIHNAIRLHRAEAFAADAERDRLRLLVLEQAARTQAEEAQRRLVFLAEAGTRLAASLDHQATLESAARLLVPSFADWCLVDLALPDGGFERVAVAHRDPSRGDLAATLRGRHPAVAEPTFGPGRVIASGLPEYVHEVAPGMLDAATAVQEEDATHLRLLREVDAQSYMCLPLPARGRTVGAMTLVSCDPQRRYSQDDLAFAEEVARRAAIAVDNARLYRDATGAEERLRHQLDFTRAITDSLAEGLVALDEEGRFTFVNPAAEQMLGWRAEELHGLRLHDVIHHQEQPAESCPLFQAVREGRLMREEDDVFRRRDGATFPVSYAVSPIASGGRRAGTVLAFHDIAERRRAEAELDESRRQLAMSEKLSALGTLVSGVAHELRTPLTYVSNNLFLVQARLDAAARERPELSPLYREVLEFSRAAIEGVDRIDALVRDLRPFTQGDGGARRAASLDEVVAGAVELFRATHRGRVDLDARLDPTPRIPLDRGQVQRVVINLLANAAEAMPHGGAIRIRTRPAPQGGAELVVEDEGEGIAPHVQSRIFDPFFTTKPEGTGLGLAITRRILDMHGATIRVDTRPGHGTRFTVHLPDPDARVPLPAPAGERARHAADPDDGADAAEGMLSHPTPS